MVRRRTAWMVSSLFIVLVIFGPFLLPVPRLAGTVPPVLLADNDSQFVKASGVYVHYKAAGTGEPAIILLHGFGASVFSWRDCLGPLSQFGRVVAFDRPAFGLTERPPRTEWAGQNPYQPEYQVNLTIALMDELGIGRAILVGHSAGGTLAVQTALRHPERIAGLILEDAAIYRGGGSPLIRALAWTPQMRRIGPLLVRSLRQKGDILIRSSWHDPSRVTPEILAGYHLPLQAENWDQALWELTAASRMPDLTDRLNMIKMPVLVLSGDDDRLVSVILSRRLAEDISGARLVVVPECGHLPHEEQPEAFLKAVGEFLGKCDFAS